MTAKLNLAPEAYQSSQRAAKKKQMATTIGIFSGIICGLLIVIALIVFAGQKIYITSLTGDIKDKQGKVAGYSELPAAVTSADHLKGLMGLWDQKIAVSRFFEVLQMFAPQGIAVSSLTISPDNQLELTASAKSYSLASKFANTLQAANKEIGAAASPSNNPYFTDVNLDTVSSSTSGTVDFKLTTKIAPEVTNGR